MNTFGLHGAIYSTPTVVHRPPMEEQKSTPKPPGVLRNIALCIFWVITSMPALYMLISG